MNDITFGGKLKTLGVARIQIYGRNELCYLLTCDNCETPTYHPQYDVLRFVRGAKQHFFCGHECASAFQHKMNTRTVSCETCGKVFDKRLGQIAKSAHNFCSRSCAAIYRNKHKTTGTRRSKLEKFVEKNIELHYPELSCFFNDIQTIGSELDIYFPNLKLAIQINGIFHFRPIYGQEKLNKIRRIDQEKKDACHNLGIILIEIDVSGDNHPTKTQNKRWEEIRSIIEHHMMQYDGEPEQ